MVNIGLEIERKYVISNYKYISGNWDIYMAFFEKGLDFSIDLLCYITPDKWLSRPFGLKFREHCMMPKMLNVLHVGNKIFENVRVDGVISLFKQKSNIFIASEFDEAKNVRIINTFSKNDILHPFLIDFLFSNNIDIIKKIESSSLMKLSDLSICENSCATSDAYKLIPLIKNMAKFDEDNYFSLINTGTIDKFISKWGLKEITYLGNKYMFPIVNRKNFINSFGKTYINKAIKPKLIIKGLNLLNACLDFSGNTIPGKTTLVICNNDIKILKILSAIINSKLTTFYIKNKYSSSSYCGGITFTKEMINNIPLPKNIFQSSILELVDQIIEKKHENSQFDISEYEYKINQILYNLFNLSDIDINNIEGLKS